MARPLRIQAPGLTYHVMARGVSRTSIYIDDEDRRRFLSILADVVKQYALRCHAYCQMTNHYHLTVTTSEANLSRALHQLNGDYAQWWNWRHDHAGHLFEGRFKDQVVQDDKYHLTHTEVPKELQGKGAARKLVEKVLQYIKDKNMRVVPSCTYVARYIDRNQQWHSLLSDGYQM